MRAPERLSPVFLEKIWGSLELEPWFPKPEKPIGEVWFQERDVSPLLIKLIFTTEKLSVQVHPNDDQARAAGLGAGKTEMWHILRAGPKASIALGFLEPLGEERMREASLSGEIEDLLDWKPVRPGDTWFVPAGTVHALGPDLVVCEIQQYSDVTYRMFDYGRPRSLHLDEAIAVAHGRVYGTPPTRPEPGKTRQLLVRSDFFVADSVQLAAGARVETAAGEWWVALEGGGELDGLDYRGGECIKTNRPGFVLAAVQSSFLVARLPG